MSQTWCDGIVEVIGVRDTNADFGVLFSDLMHGRLCFGADFRRVPFTDAPWSADGIDFRFSNDGLANHALSAHAHAYSSSEFLHTKDTRTHVPVYTPARMHVSHTRVGGSAVSPW